MTFWSGEKILAYGQSNPDFMSDFSDSQIDCNSYRLQMGDEYFCTSENKIARKTILRPRESFVINPGQFAFLLSKQTVAIPTAAMAFISMRAKTKFRGLINVSGFHVDPGYKGKLIFSVFNAGPSAINIGRDEQIFLIWFADLDRATGKPREEPGYTNIPNDLINGMNKELVSLYSLSKEITAIRSAQRIQGIIFGIAVAFFMTVLAGSVGYLIQNNLLSVISRKPPAAVEVNINNPPPRGMTPAPVRPPATRPPLPHK